MVPIGGRDAAMINHVWAGMILAGVLWAGAQGQAEQITTAMFRYAAEGLSTSLNLLAIITVWFGISRIAEKAGLLTALARLLTPILRPLFPSLPRHHVSLSSIAMNITANLLGLSHGATPFGLKAMQELQELNRKPDTISPPIMTFLALNSAVVTLVPTTAIALRANAGAAQPSAIVIPAAMASGLAMVCVLVADRLWRARAWRR